jgi:hypothetical protein
VAATFKARVPSGSLSHLSGNLLAAPSACQLLSLSVAICESLQWTTTDGLCCHAGQHCLGREKALRRTHLTSSSTFSISEVELRSSFRIEGGEARV